MSENAGGSEITRGSQGRPQRLPPRRLIRLDAKQVGQNATLLGAELTLVPARVQHHAALIWRHSAQVAKGTPHDRLSVVGQRLPLACGPINLHPLLEWQPFQIFDTSETALLPVGRHPVHIIQLPDKPLLIALGQAHKVRIVAQHLFLIGERHIAMLFQPGLKMPGRSAARAHKTRRRIGRISWPGHIAVRVGSYR